MYKHTLFNICLFCKTFPFAVQCTFSLVGPFMFSNNWTTLWLNWYRKESHLQTLSAEKGHHSYGHTVEMQCVLNWKCFGKTPRSMTAKSLFLQINKDFCSHCCVFEHTGICHRDVLKLAKHNYFTLPLISFSTAPWSYETEMYKDNTAIIQDIVIRKINSFEGNNLTFMCLCVQAVYAL